MTASICPRSSAGLVAQMRAKGNSWTHKDVCITLAQAYGYCWGVERAVQMAYEARKQYPERKLHITNEIIHNPAVNQAEPFACSIYAFMHILQSMA